MDDNTKNRILSTSNLLLSLATVTCPTDAELVLALAGALGKALGAAGFHSDLDLDYMVQAISAAREDGKAMREAAMNMKENNPCSEGKTPPNPNAN